MARKRQRHELEQPPEEELLPDSEDVIDGEAHAGDDQQALDPGADGVGEEEGSADESGGSFSEAIGDDGLDEFDDGDIDLKVVDEVLSHKDQNARALAIRRAIEERLESKRLSRELDYLDGDLDD